MQEMWKPKNWQQVTNIQETGEKWAKKNCSEEVENHLTYEKDGIYSDFPRKVIKLDGKYVFDDYQK